MAYRIRSGYAVTRTQTLHGALSSPKMSEGIPGGEFIHRPIRVQPTSIL